MNSDAPCEVLNTPSAPAESNAQSISETTPAAPIAESTTALASEQAEGPVSSKDGDDDPLSEELFGERMGKYADSGIARLTEEIHAIIGEDCDLETLKIGQVFTQLEERLSLDATSLEATMKDQLREVIVMRVQDISAKASNAERSETREKGTSRKRNASQAGVSNVTPTKQPRKRIVQDGEPMSATVAGTAMELRPRQTASGNLGYFGTQKIFAEVGGQKVEMQCMIHCAVLTPAEEKAAPAPPASEQADAAEQ